MAKEYTPEQVAASIRACGNGSCKDCCLNMAKGLPRSCFGHINDLAADIIEGQAKTIADLCDALKHAQDQLKEKADG